MDEDIEQIKQQAFSAIKGADSQEELEGVKIAYLGRKGKITQMIKLIPQAPAEQRGALGRNLNRLKAEIEQALEQAERDWTEKKKGEAFDFGAPPVPRLGHLHPVTIITRELNNFFRYYGYSVMTGPEIESDEYNFRRLNLPQDHPARDLQDSLLVTPDGKYVLRTHTSSIEARVLSAYKPPLRFVVPGKCYRNEKPNASNGAFFYQYQGVCVDRGINIAHLKATLIAFAKFIYGDKVETRFRCKYYPEVEPGAGLDIRCPFCGGRGECVVCKSRGWIEVLGSGMIHRNILTINGIDPAEWTGFAFGMGLDRIVMTRFGIGDIRKLYGGGVGFKP